jgi:hypothetical protein
MQAGESATHAASSESVSDRREIEMATQSAKCHRGALHSRKICSIRLPRLRWTVALQPFDAKADHSLGVIFDSKRMINQMFSVTATIAPVGSGSSISGRLRHLVAENADIGVHYQDAVLEFEERTLFAFFRCTVAIWEKRRVASGCIATHLREHCESVGGGRLKI